MKIKCLRGFTDNAFSITLKNLATSQCELTLGILGIEEAAQVPQCYQFTTSIHL